MARDLTILKSTAKLFCKIFFSVLLVWWLLAAFVGWDIAWPLNMDSYNARGARAFLMFIFVVCAIVSLHYTVPDKPEGKT